MLGVLLVKLGSEIVDEGLKFVLLLFCIGNQLILHDHGRFLLGQGRL
jgi:hypothetical protein